MLAVVGRPTAGQSGTGGSIACARYEWPILDLMLMLTGVNTCPAERPPLTHFPTGSWAELR